jgi:hypothetical protein
LAHASGISRIALSSRKRTFLPFSITRPIISGEFAELSHYYKALSKRLLIKIHFEQWEVKSFFAFFQKTLLCSKKTGFWGRKTIVWVEITCPDGQWPVKRKRKAPPRFRLNVQMPESRRRFIGSLFNYSSS